MKFRRNGFTLLEVLVVLVITGMLSVVLTQAFGFVLQIRLSVLNKIVGLETTAVERNLYLTPLAGLVPDYPEKPNVFVGTERRIHGLTTHPLQNRMGMLVPFEMYFEYAPNDSQMKLMYKESGRDPIALGGWAGEVGRFTFKDRNGPWLTSWPPPLVVGEVRPDQTPWAVRIEMGTGFPSAVVTSIIGPHDRTIRMQDTVMGSDLKLEDTMPK